MKTKKCGKCKRILPVEVFGKDSQTKDGYKNRCKECRKQDAAAFYQLHKQEINAKTSEYQRMNPEVSRAKAKRWRDTSPTAQAAMSRQRYQRRMRERGITVVEDVDIEILGPSR